MEGEENRTVGIRQKEETSTRKASRPADAS